MGDLDILRFIEEFLTMGYRVELEHVGKGVYTELTITKADEEKDKYTDLIVKNVPSNHLRDSEELIKLRMEINQEMES